MTSEAWERTHRRYRLRHAVLDDVAAAGPAVVTGRWRDAVEREYGGLAGFLREVQHFWYRTFDARLDMVLELGDDGGDTAAAVRRLWWRLADEQRPARAVLDAFAGHPALAEADAAHRSRLLAVTGVDQRTLADRSARETAADRSRMCPAGLVRRLVGV